MPILDYNVVTLPCNYMLLMWCLIYGNGQLTLLLIIQNSACYNLICVSLIALLVTFKTDNMLILRSQSETLNLCKQL
jgi:hypothetical protein